jgi:hypothetical protein
MSTTSSSFNQMPNQAMMVNSLTLQLSTDNDNVNNSISSTLQNEYVSLQSHWQITLNKHHSNLALQAGLSTATSKFASKAVDVSFWEQVQSSVEHELLKKNFFLSLARSIQDSKTN